METSCGISSMFVPLFSDPALMKLGFLGQDVDFSLKRILHFRIPDPSQKDLVQFLALVGLVLGTSGGNLAHFYVHLMIFLYFSC